MSPIELEEQEKSRTCKLMDASAVPKLLGLQIPILYIELYSPIKGILKLNPQYFILWPYLEIRPFLRGNQIKIRSSG